MTTRRYLQGATGAATWIGAHRQGASWPSDPSDPRSLTNSVYSGTAGIVLFLAELFSATGDAAHLDHAVAAADHLVASIDDEQEVGLYSGLAGYGVALEATARLTGDWRYLEAARTCAGAVVERATRVGDGIEWQLEMPDESGRPQSNGRRSMCTDVIAGSAGVGLWLVDAAGRWQDDVLLQAAADTGRRLLELADEVDGGLDWPMAPGLPYRMPNFSHGTAGVAFFLATLAMATGERAFLDAAVRGGRFLQSIAVTNGDIALIPHSDDPSKVPGGDGKVRYALSWCHGPAGTGATWYRLYQATQGDEWLDWLRRSARAYVPGRIPEELDGNVGRVDPPGTWASFCYCHGSSGNGEFLLNAAAVLDDDELRGVAFRMADDCLAQGVADGEGMCWAQNGVRFGPDGSMAVAQFPQTGFSTGAAGIGYAMLRFDAHLHGRVPVATLPDWPFADVWASQAAAAAAAVSS